MGRKKVELDRPCVEPGVTFEERADGRFCLSCRELQHDLRDATRSAALALLDANGGRLCGRFRVGPTGELKFRADPPTKSATKGALLALALAACDPPEPSVVPEPTVALPPPSVALPPNAEPAPPTTPETAPPTSTVDTTSGASVEPSHETDDSLDPNDHAGHWHTHPPVRIGHGERHGGARAIHTDDPDDPFGEL